MECYIFMAWTGHRLQVIKCLYVDSPYNTHCIMSSLLTQYTLLVFANITYIGRVLCAYDDSFDTDTDTAVRTCCHYIYMSLAWRVINGLLLNYYYTRKICNFTYAFQTRNIANYVLNCYFKLCDNAYFIFYFYRNLYFLYYYWY